MTVAFRDAEPEDMAFVVSSWSRGFKASDTAGMVASEDWESVMHPQIKKVLARPTSRAIVAYESRDPAFLYGFCAGDVSVNPPIVYFAYVKAGYRRSGFARGLLDELGVDPSRPFFYTCWTPVVPKLAAAMRGGKHDPNFARYPSNDPTRRSDQRWNP